MLLLLVFGSFFWNEKILEKISAVLRVRTINLPTTLLCVQWVSNFFDEITSDGRKCKLCLGGFALADNSAVPSLHQHLFDCAICNSGLFMRISKVELMDVALKGCTNHGLYIPHSISETTVVATRCEFANSGFGAVVWVYRRVYLYKITFTIVVTLCGGIGPTCSR